MISKDLKLYLVIGLIVLFLFVSIYFVIDAKKNDSEENKEYELPTDNGTSNLNEVDKYKVSQVTYDLFNEIDGANFGYDEVPLRALLELSDTSFVAVYNLWTKEYKQRSGGDSLIEALRNEWGGWGAYNTNRDAIINRYNRLGISN